MNSNFQNDIKRGSPNRVAGFTLLEMMIAIAILIFISIAIYQATTETYYLRDVLSNEGDFQNGIRLSMNIMQRDISLIYSPVIMLPEKKQQKEPVSAQEMEALMSGDLSRTLKFWGPAEDSSGIRPSRFVGTSSKVSFISASHIRIYKNTTESELAKITYELKPETASTEFRDTMILVKTESPNVFEDDDSRDKLTASFSLLRGIKKLSYRFYQKSKDQWHTSWDSDKEEFKKIYPDIIEVTVDVIGPAKLNFQGIFKFRPEIPINEFNPST
ncbi:MAG: prepilin-type N-terminal cleavage/methylation domain-containing protein [Bdellovibrionota bacterium]